MIAAACLAAEPVVVDGSARMRERPIAEGVEMLRQLGATIEYVEEEGRLPVRVVPSENFKGGMLEVGKTQSSQFMSAVLLISPFLKTDLNLKYPESITSESYVYMTVDLLGEWGVDIKTKCRKGTSKTIRSQHISPAQVHSYDYFVELDASSAVYPAAAALINPNSVTRLKRLEEDSRQPDMKCILKIKEYGELFQGCPDEIGIVGHSTLLPIKMDMRNAPDGAIMLAVVASCAVDISHITGLHTLRVKETDRIAALATELRKIGCTVETTDDSLTIDPSTRHNDPVIIETYNDHRMAMAFAVLGLARPGISIQNPSCVAKSYPGFWKDFATLYA